jgi:Protein of unknown function (DUF2865)
MCVVLRRGYKHLSCKVIAGLLAAVMLAATVPATPAAAQNIFNTLFGSFRRSAPPPPPPPVSISSDAFRSVFQGERRPHRESVRSSGGIGPRVAYCVRLCDGRYFPLQRQRNASAVTQCSTFCPASETKIFSGSGIEHAVASNGQRYASLPNAFLYRKQLVPGCTCNGASTAGVAPVPVDDDSTLRPGDIVANNSGLTVYRGQDRERQPLFTPIESANLSPNLRERLAGVKIAPQLPAAAAAEPAEAETEPAPAPQRQARSIIEDLRLSQMQ